MNNRITSATLFASIAAILSIALCTNIIDKNILIYIISLSVYMIIYAAVIFGGKYLIGNNFKKIFDTNIYIYGFAIVLLICIAHYFINMKSFYGYYGWNIMPKWLTIVVLVGFIIFSCIKIRSENKTSLWPLYFVFIILYAYSRYNPNIINADVYDADAYLTQIYNVSYNTPYNIDTVGIYGHYGIFFWLPMKLFGNNIITISIFISIVSAIAFGAYCYVVENLINNSYIKILVVMSALLESLYALPYSYYQTSPNRYLFPALLMAYIVYDMRKKGAWYIGFILSSLAFLWNLESGVVVSVGWAIYSLLKNYQKTKKIISKFNIYNIVAIPIELFVAIGIVSVYNILCGGKIEFISFFYPYNHHLDDFSLPIVWGNYAYIYVIPIFMSVFMWALMKVKLLNTQSKYAPCIAAMSVIGIGYFSYYMNRFAMCNVWMIVWQLALILGILLDKNTSNLNIRTFFSEKSKYLKLKIVMSFFSIALLSMLSLGNVFSIGMQQALFEQGTKDCNQIYAWSKEIESIVPKDTYAAGYGIWSVYSVLGWDTKYHINDLPNLVARPDALESFYNNLYLKDAVVVADDFMDMNQLMELGNFNVEHTFQFGQRTYYYLKK